MHQRETTEGQVRETLHRSEMSLRLLAAQLPALVWTTNAELRITSMVGGGRLWYDPATGRGVIFHLALPTP